MKILIFILTFKETIQSEMLLLSLSVCLTTQTQAESHEPYVIGR